MSAPPSVEKLFMASKRAVRDEDWVSAFEAFDAVLKRFPANNRAKKGLQSLRPNALPAILNMAQELQSGGEWVEAERHLRIAAALAPDMVQVLLALAACQLHLGQAPKALKTAEQVLQSNPGNTQALIYKGRAQREMSKNHAAEQSFLAAAASDPSTANALNNLGITARARGDSTAATEYYQRALALEPENVELHHNLAQSKTYTSDDNHIENMRQLVKKLSGSADAAPLHFAMFKALNDLGEHAEAFGFLRNANQLASAAAPYDFKKDAMTFALTKSLMSTALTLDPTEVMTPRPIFVTGLPRTGTTLVERILTRDPDVQACGELSVVQLAVGKMLKGIMGRERKSVEIADLQALRQDIIAGLAEYSDGRPVIIDKAPLNFRWIGYICAALPEARIVHIARDPIPVAWSLYRLSFTGPGNGFIYDFADIAKYMVLHRNYMAHWRSILPGRVFDIIYEALISDTDQSTRALAEATGLTWTDAWLRPEEAKNQVLTASAHQVQRPIYQGSNAGWRPYEDALKPMIKQLEDAQLLTA